MRAFVEQIRELIVKDRLPIRHWQKKESEYHGPTQYVERNPEWVPFHIGESWSEEEHLTTFFKTRAILPAEWAGEKVYFYARTGGEACIFIDGKIYHGLDENHHDAPIDSQRYAGQEMEILIEAALHRINKIYVPDPEYAHRFTVAEFQLINIEAEEFYYNLLALVELDELLQVEGLEGADRIHKLLIDLREKYQTLRGEVQEEAMVDFAQLNHHYQEAVQELGKEESYKMACFGHAHIDVAWLWQFKETIRKSGRTFSTAIRLMEAYPDFQFIQSQPQLYQYIKEYYPTLYEEIQEKIKTGQWQPEGGMWVEADTNLVSGESLVRQFLYGKDFFQKEFGVESRILWLPDVFGYVGSLPQIMRKAGIDYFMTSKISWNDTNDFPYAVFHWEGIDGSRVLTHIPRVILPFTYNGEVYADKVYKVKANYEEQKKENVFEYKFGDSSNYFKKDRVIPDDQLMYIYGYGDGGGGVTREFIEKIKRFDQLPYLPRMEYSQPVKYFENLEADQAHRGMEYPTWRGELYFEYHRGVYTSQAKTKLNNRRAETNIRHAEILSTLTGQKNQTQIRELWQKLATNQFHDIIPGTSITEVYQDVDQIYEEVHQKLDQMITTGLTSLAKRVTLLTDQQTGNVAHYLVWNGLSYQRDSLFTLLIPVGQVTSQWVITDLETGQELEWIARKNNDFMELQIYLRDLPAFGYRVIQVTMGDEDYVATVESTIPHKASSGQKALAGGQTSNSRVTTQPHVKTPDTDCQEYSETGDQLIVENSHFRLSFTQGQLLSIYDKSREMELIAQDGIANELQFFVDQPPRYQAWEQVAEFEELRIDEKLELRQCQVKDFGSQKVIQLIKGFRDSTFTQEIILDERKRRIDFATQVDWREREVMVKTAFPVRVNSDQARYEIAFGNLTRSTTKNTDYEKAQFEVPAYRWADISQPGLGVSLINDCKYGYDIKGNLMRLTLLKGPNYPDPTADYGIHHFTYSFYVHDGIYYQSELLKHAEDLNTPLLGVRIPAQQSEGRSRDLIINTSEITNLSKGFCAVSKGNSRVEVLKQAETQDGWILRLYEPYGGREKVQLDLTIDKGISQAQVVNLIERPLPGEEVQWSGNQLSFTMEPFEIKTILVQFE